MGTIVHWIIVLIVGGISLPGEVQYPTVLECERALDKYVTGIYEGIFKGNCVPIYERKGDLPDFTCGDYEAILCQSRHIGQV